MDGFRFAPYSHSKISKYLMCPKEFEITYISKIKPEFKADCLVKGINLHNILANYPNSAFDSLKSFFETEIGKKYHEILTGNNKRELRFGLTKDFHLTKYSYSNIINGIIDLIYIKDGMLYLVDWKSGKAKSYDEQDWSQLELSAIAFLDRYDVTVSYVYIEHGTENTRVYKKAQRDELIKSVMSRIGTIENTTEFNRVVSWHCQYCAHRNTCNSTIQEKE